MNIRRLTAGSPLLRSIFFPLLRNINFEIKWKHDVTHRRLFIMTWLHKGYWYYGSKREQDELLRFNEFIKTGDCVFEVGGHIGYVSQIFEDLIGEDGSLFVAEPTKFSREFLERNVRATTTVLPFALSDTVGKMDFYTEEFGGFTNSLVHDFTEQSDEWLRNSQKVSSTSVKKVSVPVSTLDVICEEYAIQPSFLKIDVEGAELNVLRGGSAILKGVTALMVEISKNNEEIYRLLLQHGFSAKDKRGQEVNSDFTSGNIFFYRAPP